MNLVEICCGSYEDALASYKGGAQRIELNSALYLGGLTPSIATLIETKKNTDLEVISMVRPRGAGFCYSDTEKLIMYEDAKLLLKYGSDGIAFGFLDDEANIELESTRMMVEIIHSYNKEAVFHRAFDCVKDPYNAIEKLIEVGVDRVLTAGLAARAEQGIELLKKLQIRYGDKIQILPGSGVTSSNVEKIMKEVNVSQIHSSCKGYGYDSTTFTKRLNFAYLPDSKAQYEKVLEKKVKDFVLKVKSLQNS